jgi:hypothetical protein
MTDDFPGLGVAVGAFLTGFFACGILDPVQ